MAAVLAPEERPRFEKTLQDMTVCLTPACELTSVYKVTTYTYSMCPPWREEQSMCTHSLVGHARLM